MGASFRNKGQIIELAGCDKLTIAPKLLKALKESKEPVAEKLNDEAASKMEFEKISIDEKKFRYMLNEDAMGTEKLAEGIRKFGVAAQSLEAILKEKLGL